MVRACKVRIKCVYSHRTKKVVPGGAVLPSAERIHFAPVRIMPTLGIFSGFLSLWSVHVRAAAFRSTGLMNRQMKKRYVSALSIAGSDPSGGAGLQADLKTFSALGVYGATAVTAVTVQNTVGVRYVHALPPQAVYDQIAAVIEDIRPDAVKVGMVNDAATLDAVVRALETYRPRHIVVDPVMVSTSGCALMQADALRLMKEKLLPMADIVTPNLPEAFTLAGDGAGSQDGGTVRLGTFDAGDTDRAAERILGLGVRALLIKGGHAQGSTKTDCLYTADASGVRKAVLSAPSVDTVNTHGTGCTLSSAIAAMLARGLDMESAVRCAKEYLHRALVAGAGVVIGEGHGPVDHFFAGGGFLRRDLLKVMPESVRELARMQFITHFTDRYSYYDSAVLALEGGCRWIQLRMKDASADELESTARRILPLCRSCGAVFIVDDNLDVALRTGADGVHLGKNDMPVDEARRLAGDGFIIGGTANTFDDVCRLVSQGADYIGCGPFRFTSTKKNLSPVLGLEGYRDIVARMRRGGIGIPLVAIGGIACGDIAEILGTGVSGIALSGSVLRAADPAGEMRRVADTVVRTTENIHNDIWTARSE